MLICTKVSLGRKCAPNCSHNCNVDTQAQNLVKTELRMITPLIVVNAPNVELHQGVPGYEMCTELQS
jgi:hypothetical protein